MGNGKKRNKKNRKAGEIGDFVIKRKLGRGFVNVDSEFCLVLHDDGRINYQRIPNARKRKPA